MASSSNASSSSELKPGILNFKSVKRRLAFIKKWWHDDLKETPSMVLKAASDIPGIPSRRDPTRLFRDWNPPGTYYINVDLLKYSGHTFTPFKVIVPLLYYVGLDSEVNRINRNREQIQSTWREQHRRQIGSHVFINRYGELSQVHCYIETLIGRGGRTRQFYEVTIPHPLDSIYPVIRCETHDYPNPVQNTVLGMQYRYFDDYNNSGDRYYHRYDNKQLKKGGAFEIIKKPDENVSVAQTTFFFGFFVCAGARLIVFDECQYEYRFGKHNLALIQQGGMVFIEVSQDLHLNFTEGFGGHKTYFGRQEFIQRLRAVNGNTDGLNGIRNPIIFIGANDSNHNSIAWNLSVTPVMRQNDYTGELRAELTIPEGARIVAIADAVQGIQEINERIHYEYLHDSVLTNHGIVFRACHRDSIERILNVNEVRSYYYVHMDFLTPVEERYAPTGTTQAPARPLIPLFRQFNVRKIIAINPDYLNDEQKTMCPPLPPMYPPLYTTRPNARSMIHIPNQTNSDRVEDCYPREHEFNPQSTDPYEQNYYFYDWDQDKTIECRLYSTLEHSDNNWLRLKDQPKKFSNYLAGFGDGVGIDGVNKRIGVDGWIWEKQPDSNLERPPFLCETIFYCSNVDKVDGLDANASYNQTTDTYIPPRTAPPTQPVGGWQVPTKRKGKGKGKRGGSN